MRTTRFAASMLALALVRIAAGQGDLDQAWAQARQPSLYERLGGAYAIATVVDDFVDRLSVNATLNANPAISAARAHVPKAGLKFHVTALVCEATGGPCKYTGRTMKEAHRHLNITPAQWDAMVADFKTTLNAFHVPVPEQQELITIVGGTRQDIVHSGP